MASRLIACRNTVTGGEQSLPDRALALGMFPNWEPIEPDDAAHVNGLKPAPEPAVEPEAPAPTRKRKAADAGHDNNEE